MEDYSRDLEKELNKYSVPNPFKQSRNWQLLFVSDDGKTIAVKRYKGLVISILVALVTAILFSICMTVLYYKSSMEKKLLKLAVEKADKELRKATDERELLNAKLFFEQKENTIITDTTSDVSEEKKKKTKPQKVEKKPKPTIEKVSVGVEAFTMTRVADSKYTKIKFHIRNLSKVKRISGYVFVILKPESGKQQDWLVLPPVLLKDEEPSIYKRGRFFSINHFKSMNFKFKNNFEGEYKNATVFVYSKPADSSGESLKVVETSYPVKMKIIKKKPTVTDKKNTVKKTEDSTTKTATGIKTPRTEEQSIDESVKKSSNKKETEKKRVIKTPAPVDLKKEKTEPLKNEVVEGASENAN